MDIPVFWVAYGWCGAVCTDWVNRYFNLDGNGIQTNQQVGVLSGMAIYTVDVVCGISECVDIVLELIKIPHVRDLNF